MQYALVLHQLIAYINGENLVKKIRGNYVSLKRYLVCVGLVIAAISIPAPASAELVFDFSFEDDNGVPFDGSITGLEIGTSEALTITVTGGPLEAFDFVPLSNVNQFAVGTNAAGTGFDLLSFEFNASTGPTPGQFAAFQVTTLFNGDFSVDFGTFFGGDQSSGNFIKV